MSRRAHRHARRIAALGLLLPLHGPFVATAESLALPRFERAELLPLPADACQELQIGRVGASLLEVRFFTNTPERPAGPDPKTSGASLLLPAEDPERASLAFYHGGGIYEQSLRAPAPVRWMRRGSELCIASGSEAVACGPSDGEIQGTVRIAFGAGWETQISGCSVFPLRERWTGAWAAALVAAAGLAALALRSSRRARDVLAVAVLAAAFACGVLAVVRPWLLPNAVLLPSGVIASGVVAVWALLERGRSRSGRAAWIALACVVGFALLRVPHPVWTRTPADPVVPMLWLDGANWQPQGAHQALGFRGRPLASLEPGVENWLVVGGSVAFGDGVAAHQAFPAVAQDLLRAAGDRKVLLNGGVQGWNIHNIDRLLADLGDALPVTGIVLVSILNNATLPIAAPDRVGCERSLIHAGLCNSLRNQLIFTWPKVFLPKPRNPERYRSTLRRLLERELALGRQVVLLDEASEIDSGPIRLWNADTYRAIARTVASEFGVPFHPVADALAPLPPEQRFLDGIHPTAAAHALLGRRLYEILRDPH